MIKIPPQRTLRQILEKRVGKRVKIKLAKGSVEIKIIAVGADCIQADKLGKNFIPLSAIQMITF